MCVLMHLFRNAGSVSFLLPSLLNRVFYYSCYCLRPPSTLFMTVCWYLLVPYLLVYCVCAVVTCDRNLVLRTRPYCTTLFFFSFRMPLKTAEPGCWISFECRFSPYCLSACLLPVACISASASLYGRPRLPCVCGVHPQRMKTVSKSSDGLPRFSARSLSLHRSAFFKAIHMSVCGLVIPL